MGSIRAASAVIGLLKVTPQGEAGASETLDCMRRVVAARRTPSVLWHERRIVGTCATGRGQEVDYPSTPYQQPAQVPHSQLPIPRIWWGQRPRQAIARQGPLPHRITGMEFTPFGVSSKLKDGTVARPRPRLPKQIGGGGEICPLLSASEGNAVLRMPTPHTTPWAPSL